MNSCMTKFFSRSVVKFDLNLELSIIVCYWFNKMSLLLFRLGDFHVIQGYYFLTLYQRVRSLFSRCYKCNYWFLCMKSLCFQFLFSRFFQKWKCYLFFQIITALFLLGGSVLNFVIKQ